MQAGLAGLGMATDPGYAQLAAQAATLVVILPYSRTQEAEADHIGMIYMAEAGYDPREAIALWQNFESFGGARPRNGGYSALRAAIGSTPEARRAGR